MITIQEFCEKYNITEDQYYGRVSIIKEHIRWIDIKEIPENFAANIETNDVVSLVDCKFSENFNLRIQNGKGKLSIVGLGENPSFPSNFSPQVGSLSFSGTKYLPEYVWCGFKGNLRVANSIINLPDQYSEVNIKSLDLLDIGAVWEHCSFPKNFILKTGQLKLCHYEFFKVMNLSPESVIEDLCLKCNGKYSHGREDDLTRLINYIKHFRGTIAEMYIDDNIFICAGLKNSEGIQIILNDILNQISNIEGLYIDKLYTIVNNKILEVFNPDNRCLCVELISCESKVFNQVDKISETTSVVIDPLGDSNEFLKATKKVNWEGEIYYDLEGV